MNTFYHGDCLFVMKHDIAPDSVDLIYLDPPFFTGKIQKGKWLPNAMEVSYEDSKQFWKEKGVASHAPHWLKHIAIGRPDFASYLFYMMERLEACHKVLNKSGSIFLHCDWRASHYLKMIMDEIFTDDNFRNEIAWHYSGWNKKLSDKFEARFDSILFYAKGKEQKFHSFTVPWESKEEYVRIRKQKVRLDDEGQEYVLSDAGSGKRVKRYLVEAMAAGRPIDNVWDIDKLNNSSKESTGYPTQKPEALLERIIKSASDENDLVLDPFCGCGTTAIVASKLNRRFVGVDIDTSERKPGELPTAFTVIKNRGHELFGQASYVTRDITEVLEMDGNAFESWVNEFYKATKPHPDKGVDGITHEGYPIQSKVYEIKYDKLSQFINDAKYHHSVPKPLKKIMAVSQAGFDDSARKLKFQIETAEGIEVDLITPQGMLTLT